MPLRARRASNFKAMNRDSSELTRRRFLEGCAATLGVALVGCSSGENGAPVAKAESAGVWTLEIAAPKAGEAVAFRFVDEAPGILFRDKIGELGAVNAVCTHAGCTVEWIDGAKPSGAAFRCPCHESKFTSGGQTLGGPAKKPLPAFEARDLGNGKIELRAKGV